MLEIRNIMDIQQNINDIIIKTKLYQLRINNKTTIKLFLMFSLDERNAFFIVLAINPFWQQQQQQQQ